MNRSMMAAATLATALVVAASARLWAFPEAARETKAACAACHVNPAGGALLTEAGQVYKAEKKAPAPSSRAAEFVGNDRCRMCHPKEHKAYLGTPHAKAWATIASADAKIAEEMAKKLKVDIKGSPATTDECVRCHVTGFQLPGGYPQTEGAKATAVTNVGCESCHGPGSLHISAAKAERKNFITTPGASLCVQCHTPAVSPSFQYEEYAKRGIHNVAEAE